MAWKSGFFNSVNGDRLYNADDMSKIFEGLITDGVYESVGNKLAVQPNSGMTIQIASGRGWFNKRWVENSTPYTLTIESADVTLNRYAAVCIKVDNTDSVRNATPYIKYSEYATTAVKPIMTRTDTVKEYCLAYVYIPANTKTITASLIEDTRGNNDLCGWVTGLIEQLSTTTLFTQWQSIFDNWFNNLGDLINENTETMLVNALPNSTIITLSSTGWTESSGVYTQSVTVQGMTETKTVISQANAETTEAYAASDIKCTAQSTNSVTFTATNLPTQNIKVDFVYFGV